MVNEENETGQTAVEYEEIKGCEENPDHRTRYIPPEANEADWGILECRTCRKYALC